MTIKVNIAKPILLLTLVLFGKSNLWADGDSRRVTVQLYGHVLQFTYQPETFSDASIPAVTQTIWQSAQTTSLIQQMNNEATRLQMDDMAWLILLNKFTSVAYKNQPASIQTLFKYALLFQKNIDVVLGYSEQGYTLYGRTNFEIDNCLYIRKQNKTYYDLSFSQQAQPQPEQEFTPITDHHKRLPLVMNMINPPAFNAKQAKKVLPFEYDGFVYFISGQVNQSLVEYYHDLPTISINTVYLNYGLSELAKQSFTRELKRAVADMPKAQALDFILKFTQTAIEYRKDKIEKFAFPEETLVADFADCEDKAVLFATLVYQVLGMKSVALYYKNAEHINVAVESWNKNIEGNFTFNSQAYVVCEPSGKGFAPGENSLNSQLANLIDW